MKHDEFESKFPGLNAARALEVYLKHGPTAAAATALGVSQETFRTWTMSFEGRKAIDLARSSLNQLLDLGLTNIINQASSRVLDALENGEEYVDRNGEIKHVKLRGKDAAGILALVFDRRQLLRKQPTQIGGELDEKLEELAVKLRYLGQGVSSTEDRGPKDADSLDSYTPRTETPALSFPVGTTGPYGLDDSRYTISATDEGN